MRLTRAAIAAFSAALLVLAAPADGSSTRRVPRALRAVLQPLPVRVAGGLARLDPRTGQVSSFTANGEPTEDSDFGFGWWDRSPDGKQLAFCQPALAGGPTPRITVIDVSAGRVRGSVQARDCTGIFWLTPTRVLATGAALTLIDASRVEIVDTADDALLPALRLGRRPALLATPGSYGLGQPGPYRLVSIDARGRLRVDVTSLWPGVETALGLSPRARGYLANARADLAARLGVPESELVDVAATPRVWGSSARGCGNGGAPVLASGYQIILGARSRLFDYRYSFSLYSVGGGFCQELPAVPEDVRPNLLAQPPVLQTTGRFGVNAAGTKLYLPGERGAPSVEVDTASFAPTERPLSFEYDDQTVGYVRFDDAIPGGVVLTKVETSLANSRTSLNRVFVNTRDWTTRPIPDLGSCVSASTRTVFVYGLARDQEPRGVGAYDSRGAFRYTLFPSRAIEWVRPLSRGYSLIHPADTQRVYVIRDVSGRIVWRFDLPNGESADVLPKHIEAGCRRRF